MANLNFFFYTYFVLSSIILIAVFSFRSKSVAFTNSRCNAGTEIVADSIQTILNNTFEVKECGPGIWLQIAHLNLSDTQQTCPTPWSTTNSPSRFCISSTPPCSSVFYNSDGVLYSKVCGMATGVMLDTVDTFYRSMGSGTIDEAYLDGVSITHGNPRQHIWSLAAGHGPRFHTKYRCPCDVTDSSFAVMPPPFVGENYFCDGDYNGALWDGKDCTLPSGCCTFNSPPWFSTTLPYSTSDQVEVRICQDQDHDNEGVFLTILSLYVQ